MLSNYEKGVAELNKDVTTLGIKIEAAIEKSWKALENFGKHGHRAG